MTDPSERTLRAALYMCAAHCQGGHSEAGAATAEVLGVPFPLRMTDLIARARHDGFNPAALWPWMWRSAHQGRQPWFTPAELEGARKGGSSPNPISEGE